MHMHAHAHRHTHQIVTILQVSETNWTILVYKGQEKRHPFITSHLREKSKFWPQTPSSPFWFCRECCHTGLHSQHTCRWIRGFGTGSFPDLGWFLFHIGTAGFSGVHLRCQVSFGIYGSYSGSTLGEALGQKYLLFFVASMASPIFYLMHVYLTLCCELTSSFLL